MAENLDSDSALSYGEHVQLEQRRAAEARAGADRWAGDEDASDFAPPLPSDVAPGDRGKTLYQINAEVESLYKDPAWRSGRHPRHHDVMGRIAELTNAQLVAQA